MAASDPAEVSRAFFQAYADGDRERAASLLAEGAIAYITNADAGVDTVTGRDEYMARVPDLQANSGRADITQVVRIDDERAMTMVEIHAERDGKKLHNFAGFLARVANGQIAELWMVDAKPAYSDEFWS